MRKKRAGGLGNRFETERLVAEATEDEDDPDFEPGEEEVSIAEFVKKRRAGRFCSANSNCCSGTVVRVGVAAEIWSWAIESRKMCVNTSRNDSRIQNGLGNVLSG
jgi:hypothetical protein